MSKTVRVIVVNTDEDVASDLRAVLLGIDGVKIVAEVDEPAMLAQALEQIPAEALLVHLDPVPANMMDVVAPLIEAHKNSITAIAMTEDRDAELVMRAMRAGMREFLWKPFPPEQLAEVLQRIASESGRSGRRIGRLITAVGTGGGMGVTSLCINVGVELGQFDRWDGQPSSGGRPRVAVVDLDFRFGQVAMQLDVQPSYTIAELCETPEQIDAQMLDRAMVKHNTGVHVLSRPTDLAQAERISAGQCAGVLGALQEHYDFVICDLPARFDPTARAVYDMVDTYLVVLQLMVPSVRTADRLLRELEASGYATARVRLVCNRFGRESGYLEPDDVEATLKRKLDFMIPDEWRTSASAVNMGAALLTHAPRSKLRHAYRQIAHALAGDGERHEERGGEEEESGKKGLFGFFAGSKA